MGILLSPVEDAPCDLTHAFAWLSPVPGVPLPLGVSYPTGPLTRMPQEDL